jgi:hypothetical protein
MIRPRTLLVGLAIAALLAFFVACGGGGDDDDAGGTAQPAATATTASGSADTPEATEEEDDAEATATEEDEEPTATEEEDEPTPTAAEDEPTPTEESDDATATPEDDGERLVGSAETSDDEDDVIQGILMQEPDDPLPGIDLIRVALDGDGQQVTVTIETAGDIAAEMTEDQEVSFDVHLWQDDQPRYAMSFKRKGDETEWEASVTDFDRGMDEETVDTPVNVDGNTLTATFSADLFPELDPEFEWYSSVMLSDQRGLPIDAYFDGAPENIIALIGNPEEFVEFPQ